MSPEYPFGERGEVGVFFAGLWFGFALTVALFLLWSYHPSHEVEAGYGRKVECQKERVIVQESGFHHDAHRRLRLCQIKEDR